MAIETIHQWAHRTTEDLILALRQIAGLDETTLSSSRPNGLEVVECHRIDRGSDVYLKANVNDGYAGLSREFPGQGRERVNVVARAARDSSIQVTRYHVLQEGTFSIGARMAPGQSLEPVQLKLEGPSSTGTKPITIELDQDGVVRRVKPAGAASRNLEALFPRESWVLRVEGESNLRVVQRGQVSRVTVGLPIDPSHWAEVAGERITQGPRTGQIATRNVVVTDLAAAVGEMADNAIVRVEGRPAAINGWTRRAFFPLARGGVRTLAELALCVGFMLASDLALRFVVDHLGRTSQKTETT